MCNYLSVDVYLLKQQQDNRKPKVS